MKGRNVRRLGSFMLAALIAVSSMSTPALATEFEMAADGFEMSLGEEMTSLNAFSLDGNAELGIENNDSEVTQIFADENELTEDTIVDDVSEDDDEEETAENDQNAGELVSTDENLENDDQVEDSVNDDNAADGGVLDSNEETGADIFEDDAKLDEILAESDEIKEELTEEVEDVVLEEAGGYILPPKCNISISVDNSSGLIYNLSGYQLDEKDELIYDSRFNVTPDKMASIMEIREGYSLNIDVVLVDAKCVPVLKVNGVEYNYHLTETDGRNKAEYGSIRLSKDDNITISAKPSGFASFVHDSDVKIRLYKKRGRTDFEYYDLEEDKIYLVDQLTNVGAVYSGFWKAHDSFYQIDGTDIVFSASSPRYKNFKAYADGVELKTTKVEVIDGTRQYLYAFNGIITTGTVIEIKPYIGTRIINNFSGTSRSNISVITHGVVINDGMISVEDKSIQEFEIRIKNKFPYTHSLSFVNGNTKTVVTPIDEITEKDGVTKVYKLSSSAISNLDSIQLDESIKQNKVTVSFDNNVVDVQARKGVSILAAEGNTYVVDNNDTITFKVKAQRYYAKPSVYVDGVKAKLNSAGEFNLKVTKDTSLDIEAEAVIENVIYDTNSERNVSAINTEYDNARAFYIYVSKGAYDKIKIDKASVKIGTTVHEVNSDNSQVDILSLEENGTKLFIRMSDHVGPEKEMAGKTYKLSYTYNDGKKNVTKNVNIVVNAVPEKITIKGMDLQGRIYQMPGTRIEYPVIIDKKVDINRIFFWVDTGKASVDFNRDTRKIRIYVPDTDRGPGVIRAMYNSGDYRKEAVEIARFEYVSDYSKMNNSKPIVKYRPDSSTDKQVALTLSFPKSILDFRKKNLGLYSLSYHVTLTEKVTDGREPVVIERNFENLSSVSIVENFNCLVDASQCEPGTLFDVRVRLYNNYEGYSSVNENEFSKETVIVAATKKASDAIKMSVKLPKNKLVSGTSTGISGKVVFNKEATNVDDYTIESPDSRFRVNCSHDDFTISCSDRSVPAGKYKFLVYSADKKLTTSFYVIVQQGITSMKIDMPSVNYKKYGSALTIKPKLIFNDGLTKPVNKKLEWQLYDIDNGKYVEGGEGVSVNKKTGVVTFAKNYKIPADAKDGMHSFRIDAKAENNISSCSYSFKISAKPIIISDIVVGSYNIYESIPDVVNTKGSCYVVDENGSLLECRNYDIKVSKGLDVTKGTYYSDAYFYLNGFTKPGKYTITVSTKDGGKSVLKKTICMGYGKAKKALPGVYVPYEGHQPYETYISECERVNVLNKPFTMSREGDTSPKDRQYFIEPSKVTVKGGTMVTDYNGTSEKITITPNAEVTTIVWECEGKKVNYTVHNK